MSRSSSIPTTGRKTGSRSTIQPPGRLRAFRAHVIPVEGLNLHNGKVSATARRVNLKDLLSRERVLRFMRFVTVGASVAVIDCGGVAIFSRCLAPLVAVTVAYFIAVCFHFFLNKFWVFRCRRSDYLKQMFSYGIVTLNNWVITLIVVTVCLSTFTKDVVVAKLCAIPCATMCNFLLMQLVVFRPHRSQDKVEPLQYAEVESE